MSGLIVGNRSCWALTRGSGVESADRPDYSCPETIHNQVNCLTGWLPMLFDALVWAGESTSRGRRYLKHSIVSKSETQMSTRLTLVEIKPTTDTDLVMSPTLQLLLLLSQNCRAEQRSKTNERATDLFLVQSRPQFLKHFALRLFLATSHNP